MIISSGYKDRENFIPRQSSDFHGERGWVWPLFKKYMMFENMLLFNQIKKSNSLKNENDSLVWLKLFAMIDNNKNKNTILFYKAFWCHLQ